MTPYVLILMLKVGFAGGVVSIDMPDRESCIREGQKADSLNFVRAYLCINREPQK